MSAGPGIAAPRHLTVGADRFEISLGRISGIFGLLFTLQAADAFFLDARSTPGMLGAASASLVIASVLCGASACLAPRHPRPFLLGAAGLYGAAALTWLLAIRHPIPEAPYPYFPEVAIASFGYLAVACKQPARSLSAGLAAAAYLGAVLALAGGVPPASALLDALFLAAIAIGMTVLVTAVRRGVRHADSVQEVALAGFARIRADDAAEAERRRTDALLHDAVLTTYLTAASARTPEEEELTVRMARNARRVLAQVNGATERGPAVVFEQAYDEFHPELQPLLSSFVVHAESLDIVVPADVADAMLKAMSAAMRCSVEHAAAGAREVRMSTLGPDGLRIIVRTVPRGLAGTRAEDPMRSTVLDLMRQVGGRADIRDMPGGGRSIVLSWGSVVMSGVDPLPGMQLEGTR